MLLEIKNLSVEYRKGGRTIAALTNASLSLEKGEVMGLIGESGCGKSTLALAILGLISPQDGRITGGEITFDGKNMRALKNEEMRQIRGNDIGIIFQDPFTSLNPVLKIREQLREAYLAHKPTATSQSVETELRDSMTRVKLMDAARILDSYPHQISGGQRQRVMIAMATLHRPKLLIADEPTTALDVTVQKDILELLSSLAKDLEAAVLIITHHLGIVARYTQQLRVLYAGEIVESGPTAQTIKNPRHPYTQALIATVPKIDGPTTGGKKLRLPVIAWTPDKTERADKADTI